MSRRGTGTGVAAAEPSRVRSYSVRHAPPLTGPHDPGTGTFGPTARGPARQKISLMQLDLGVTFLFLSGVAIAIALAVLAGSLSARIFYRASRAQEDER